MGQTPRPAATSRSGRTHGYQSQKIVVFQDNSRTGADQPAARVLHVSQPPLSKRLKELELELGVTLIHRSGTEWEVTRAGQALYQRALHVLDLVEDIPGEVKASSWKQRGRSP